MTFSFVLYFLGFIDDDALFPLIFAFHSAIIFYYFYYRMLRPLSPEDNKKDPPRTVKEILVSGKRVEDVKKEVLQWVTDEKISIEVERDNFIRGRLGNLGGLEFTASKYFEITTKSVPKGVLVHTEGWVSLFDLRELSFAQRGVFTGAVPRRKGWTVIEKLWNRLENMTN